MGRYLDIIRQVEDAHKQTGQDTEPAQWQSYPVGGLALVPGDRITWQRSDGTVNDGVIDFLHPYHDETWAFCTLPDGRWCAVNTRYVKRGDATHD